jgi:hypothetical protein
MTELVYGTKAMAPQTALGVYVNCLVYVRAQLTSITCDIVNLQAALERKSIGMGFVISRAVGKLAMIGSVVSKIAQATKAFSLLLDCLERKAA